MAAHGPTAHLRPSPAPPRLHSKAAAAVGGKGALPGWGAAGGDWAALDALADAEVRKALTVGYFEPQSSTPAALAEFIAKESVRYRRLVAEQGIKGD